MRRHPGITPQLLLALIVLTFQPAVAIAQDIAGARDYPGLPRFHGSAIRGFQSLAFDSFLLPTGPAARDVSGNWQIPNALRLEGKVTGYVYVLPPGTATLEVFRNYQDALQTAGFATLFACDDDDACGDGEILAQRVYAGSHIMQNGGLRSAQAAMYGSDIHMLSARRSADGRDAYVSLLVAKESAMGGADKDSVSVVLHVIEPKPMKNSMEFVSAAKMASDIASSGHVALYGIYFDTDSATVKPEIRCGTERDRDTAQAGAWPAGLYCRAHRHAGRLRLQYGSVRTPIARGCRGAGITLRHRTGSAAHGRRRLSLAGRDQCH